MKTKTNDAATKDRRVDLQLLEAAAGHWNAMAEFRSERERCKRYCYGRQWDDMIEVDGHRMKEEDYIRSQGNVPLKNNLIRRLVRSVLGVFRNQYAYPDAARLELSAESDADRALYSRLLLNASRNRLDELHARTMEEFLISGLAIHRKSIQPAGAPDSAGICHSAMVRTDYVAPDSFFIDSASRDFRGWDARLVGQLHELDFPALCSAMARNVSDVDYLRSIYGATSREAPFGSDRFFSLGDSGLRDFFAPSRPGMCRVIEVWTRESMECYRVHDRLTGELFRIVPEDLDQYLPENTNGRYDCSWIMDEVWTYHYLSPRGDVLAEGMSMIPGGGQPYVWKAYPFIDGEIHSFVADVIDQQRHTNRLITLYDWVIRSSAKGVLLFPESALPDDVDIDDISDEWSRFNGVILFRPKAGMPLPQQVSGGASQAGITDLLNIQMKMFEDVSGVNGALEGKLTNSNVSGTLYTQQTRQAMTALLDILESYNSFILEGARLEARFAQ